MAKDNTILYVGLAAAAALFFWQRSSGAVSDIPAPTRSTALPGFDSAIEPGGVPYYKPLPVISPGLIYTSRPEPIKIRKPLAVMPIDYRRPPYDWNTPEGEGEYYRYTKPGYLGPPVRATARHD